MEVAKPMRLPAPLPVPAPTPPARPAASHGKKHFALLPHRLVSFLTWLFSSTSAQSSGLPATWHPLELHRLSILADRPTDSSTDATQYGRPNEHNRTFPRWHGCSMDASWVLALAGQPILTAAVSYPKPHDVKSSDFMALSRF